MKINIFKILFILLTVISTDLNCSENDNYLKAVECEIDQIDFADLEEEALNGDEESQIVVGAGYLFGLKNEKAKFKLEVNLNKAKFWLNKASNSSNPIPEAYYYLACVYYKEKNYKKHFEYLNKIINASPKTSMFSEIMPDAYYDLGYIYEYGLGVDKDCLKAIEYYEKSANLNNKDAQFKLGKSYYKGDIVEKNSDKAFYWLNKSSDEKKKALVYLGRMFMFSSDPKNIEKAYCFFDKAVKEKIFSAYYDLGYMYSYGFNQDFKKSFNYFELAQAHQDTRSFLELGKIYFFGIGVVQDYDKAISYFKKSAKERYVYAYFCLGHCYEYGYGIKKDSKKALEYYNKAAHNGIGEALVRLGELYSIGEIVKEDSKKAISYFRQAIDKDYWGGYFCLGRSYHYGYGVEQNDKEAIKYYKIAIQKSNSMQAQYELSILYWEKGKHDKSLDLCRRSAEQDFASAQYSLGYGLTYIKQYKEGRSWYKKAAKQGVKAACMNLYEIYKDGVGVEKNSQKASYWSKLAEEAKD